MVEKELIHDETHSYRVENSTRLCMFSSLRGVMSVTEMMRNGCNAGDGVTVKMDKDEEDHDPVAKRRRVEGTLSVDRETTDAADEHNRNDKEKDKNDGTAREGVGKDVTADTGVGTDKSVMEDKHIDSPPGDPDFESTSTTKGKNAHTTANYYDQNDKKIDTDVVKMTKRSKIQAANQWTFEINNNA